MAWSHWADDGYNLERQRHSTKAGRDIFFYDQNITGWWVSEVARQTQTLGHVLKHSLSVCQRLAASMPSPIPTCLSVPSSLAQFSLGFSMPFLEKGGSKQKSMALLQPGFCLPSRALSTDTGWSWKREKEGWSLSTAVQERCQSPILPLFPWFSSFS